MLNLGTTISTGGFTITIVNLDNQLFARMTIDGLEDTGYAWVWPCNGLDYPGHSLPRGLADALAITDGTFEVRSRENV